MRSRRVTLSAVSALAALAAGTAGVVALSPTPAHATEGGADGLIASWVNNGIAEENADGSGLKTLKPPANGQAQYASQVAWSSDGSMLAWRNLAGDCGLYLSPSDLSSVTGLSGATYTACYGEHPTWSDANKEIVYSLFGVTGNTVTYQLYQAPVVANGGPAGPLFATDTGFNDQYPRAVGNLIAFRRAPRPAPSDNTDPVPQVWIYDQTTGSAHLAVDNAENADISPDGKSLVFTRPGSQDLFTSAIDGTGVTQLTTNGATVSHQNPVWSPSGTKIAFDNGTTSSVLDLATGTETALPGSGRMPEWQPINASAPAPPTAPSSPSTTPSTPPSTPSTPPTTPPSTPPSTQPPTNPPPPPPHVPLVQRVAGTDRFDTGVKTSRLLWPSVSEASPIHAKAVVLATGSSFPDALAGGPLAHAAQGPLLLTAPGALTGETFDEIQRVLPRGGTVYVLGGTSAVSPAVAATLTSHGYAVRRLGGTDRFATARLIADEVERLDPVPAGQPEAFVVATGQNFADALSAGPLAAVGDMPIVLSNGSTLDPATRAYLSGKEVLPVGGPAYQAVGFAPDPNEQCGDLAGADRFSTSAAVARCIADARAQAGFPAPEFIGVATGMNYADALTGGAFLGMVGDPLLLTAPQSLSGPAAGFLAGQRQTVDFVEIFGGANAVSPGVENSIVSLVGGHVIAPLTAPAGQSAAGSTPALPSASTLGFSTRPVSLPAVRAAAAAAPAQ